MPHSPLLPEPFNISQRRTQEPIEIIDVDSFESPVRPSPRRQPDGPAEVIEILDSDEETSGPSTSNSQSSFSGSVNHVRRSGARVRLRDLLSPSPPPFQFDHVPPVPPLPRHYSQYAAMPPRRRPNRVQSPSSTLEGSSRVPAPIRPVSDPFIVDLSSSPPPNERVSPEQDIIQPAARARHNPPMGFGGALISSNNARQAADRLVRQQRMERRLAGGRVAPIVAGGSNIRPPHRDNNNTGFMGRLAQMNPFRWGGVDDEPLNQIDYITLAQPRDPRARGDADLALDLLLEDQGEEILSLGERFMRYVHPNARRWRPDGQEPIEEPYKQAYTHPARAEPGFVFDFEPSEIVPASETSKGKGKQVVIDVDALESSSKGKLDALLVCARCLDPLFLRSDGVVDGGEEETRRRRLWGLRCGHVLDGKCIEELWRPSTEATVNALANGPDSKGNAPSEDVMEDDEANPRSDDESDGAGDLIPTNPIRGRLRSAGAVLGVFPVAPRSLRPMQQQTPQPTRVPRGRATTTRGRGKGKRARRSTRVSVIQDRFEWTCPVAGCGRIHVSEKVDGVWGPPGPEVRRGRNEGDVNSGPIGMFL
ncbi:hypothetical protein MIND_00222600 [Mycena indigotica]|uniref:Uncharacterized protein n=1 Tax=Mycena indigotica TaxID=2126181 RepID=A0A8H6T5E4_9AGAR|nr:uncharacterized protein MIND_00222600 [Mycena indigotica]KAF7312103.1 hypothetical protein MIND_00222600 [Mycena indigotica]